MSPIARIRIAARAALRRRYGYAAMRVLRRGVRKALRDHRARQVAPAPYSIDTDEITAAYLAAIRRLRRRWPRLNPTDPRSEIEREGP